MDTDVKSKEDMRSELGELFYEYKEASIGDVIEKLDELGEPIVELEVRQDRECRVVVRCHTDELKGEPADGSFIQYISERASETAIGFPHETNGEWLDTKPDTSYIASYDTSVDKENSN